MTCNVFAPPETTKDGQAYLLLINEGFLIEHGIIRPRKGYTWVHRSNEEIRALFNALGLIMTEWGYKYEDEIQNG